MKRIIYVIAIAVLLSGLSACSKEASTATSADSLQPKSGPSAAAAPESDKATTPGSVAAKPEPDKVRSEPKVTVPAGTKLRVALLDAVSSDKSQAGDQFMGSLTQPVVVGGKTVFAKGTKVRGRVVDAKESGRVKGLASLKLTLTEIVADGKSLNISTRPYIAVAENTKKRDAAVIGGAAGVGAAIGAIAGGGKGAAIGAAVGGGAGTGTVLGTKGKEVRYGPEHVVTFTLAAALEK